MITCTFEKGFTAKLRHVVVHAIIEMDGKLLLEKRTGDLLESGKWSLPSGFLDRDETAAQGIIREVKEETGYDFSRHPVDHLGTVFIEYDDKILFVYHMFRTQLVGDPTAVKINPHEHVDFVWATPQEGLKLPLIQDEDACFKLVYSL